MAPIIPFIPLIAAGIGAATSAVALTHQPKPPSAPSPLADQMKQREAEQAAAIAQAQALQRRRGMAATVLTSPLGTSGSAPTQSATLG